MQNLWMPARLILIQGQYHKIKKMIEVKNEVISKLKIDAGPFWGAFFEEKKDEANLTINE